MLLIVYRVHHLGFRRAIQLDGSFIQKMYLLVVMERTDDADVLALPALQTNNVLANSSLILLQHLGDNKVSKLAICW